MPKLISILACLVATTLSPSTAPVADPPPNIDPELLRGTVIPAREVMVRAAEEGVLSRLDVDEGETVTAGQEVGRIDDGIARASLATAEAAARRTGSIATAESDVAAAAARVKRYESVARKGAAPRAELEDARFALDKARAILISVREEQRKLERQRDLEAVRLARHAIQAPFAGRITRVLARPGSMMTNDTDLLRLVDLSTLHAELHLPLALYPHFAPGQRHRLQGEAPVNRELDATVVSVDPMLDPATKTFRVLLAIDNEAGKLPAGFVVRLLLPQD